MTIQRRREIDLKLRKTIAREAREIQNMARQSATAAMERLFQIVSNPKSMDSVAIAAASVLLDRGYGKSVQPNINTNVNGDGKPADLTSKELQERIGDALKRVEAATGGTSKASKGKKRPVDVRVSDRDTVGSTKH